MCLMQLGSTPRAAVINRIEVGPHTRTSVPRPQHNAPGWSQGECTIDEHAL